MYKRVFSVCLVILLFIALKEIKRGRKMNEQSVEEKTNQENEGAVNPEQNIKAPETEAIEMEESVNAQEEMVEPVKEEEPVPAESTPDSRKEKKMTLIAEAQSLQDSSDWRATSDRMKAMMEEWRKIGDVGAENDCLWEEFQKARQTFYDRQRVHFTELKKEWDQKKGEKEALIREAEEAAQSSDWKATNELMENLMARWKQISSAGKANDNKLWADFMAARDTYFTRRKEASQEQDRIFAERNNRKQALINEARELLSDPNASDRMKALNTEWKGIGFSGRKHSEELWTQFKAVQDEYWDRKRAERQARIEAGISRRKEIIESLNEQNTELQERIANTRNADTQDRLSGFIQENERRIAELQAAIDDMEKRLVRNG